VNVSILVAARNEEQNLPRLLDSIVALSYPKTKLSVLIGDDASTDATASCIKAYAAKYSHIKYVDIEPKKGALKGKTNVLAQLIALASDELLLFTDADVALPKGWVEEMTRHFRPNTGIVTGITTCDTASKRLFSIVQGIEWLTALKLIDQAAKVGMGVTGMGNNMAIRKSAYKATGGFEKIGFSIVEDYALFKAIVAKGYGFVQIYNKTALAETIATHGLAAFFTQRKRWLRGGLQSKSVLFIPAFAQALTLPFMVMLFLLNAQLALACIGLSFGLTAFAAYRALKPLGLAKWYGYIPAFYVFQVVFMFLQLLNIALPTKVHWKGRIY
jgi:cellulose synthase/poly-beta-1,6-N-acetylglucosamine synthase-like glycosyltransferase